jgi:hypothetical protein
LTNGQFHVGIIVIAFDKEYHKIVTTRNEVAEVYGYSLFRASGVRPDRGHPPFEGQGNVPGPDVLGALLALGAALVVRDRLR